MIPKIMLDFLRSPGAVLPRAIEDRLRKIAAIVNGGLDASSLAPGVKLSVANAPGAVPSAWREPGSAIVIPMVSPKGITNVAGRLEAGLILPVAGKLISWGGWVEDRYGAPGNASVAKLYLNDAAAEFSAEDMVSTRRRFSENGKFTYEWSRRFSNPLDLADGDVLRLELPWYSALYSLWALEAYVVVAVPHTS